MQSQRNLLSLLTTPLRDLRWKGAIGKHPQGHGPEPEPQKPARRRPSGAKHAGQRTRGRPSGRRLLRHFNPPFNRTKVGVESGHTTAAERLSSTALTTSEVGRRVHAVSAPT